MRAYLGLGSNLKSPAGEPDRTLRVAAERLGAAAGVGGLRLSSIYRSEPVGPAQPDYANAVAEVESALSPEELLALGQRTEAEFGRHRGVPNGPRSLDVDVLLVGAERRQGVDLTLPHPRLHLRRFVLVPLAELCPFLLHPGLGLTAAELLAGLGPGQRVELWDRVSAGSLE